MNSQNVVHMCVNIWHCFHVVSENFILNVFFAKSYDIKSNPAIFCRYM